MGKHSSGIIFFEYLFINKIFEMKNISLNDIYIFFNLCYRWENVRLDFFNFGWYLFLSLIYRWENSSISSVWVVTKSYLRGSMRGSDHCACLTGSDQKSRDRNWRDFFPYFLIPVLFPPYFVPVFSPLIFPSYFFPYFFPYFFWVLFSYIRCSLRRLRPIAIGNYPPFYFHILGVLYDVRVL